MFPDTVEVEEVSAHAAPDALMWMHDEGSSGFALCIMHPDLPSTGEEAGP